MTGLGVLTALDDTPVVVALGWTLVHFLWQGMGLGLVFVLAHRAARRGSPALRYWIGMATLAAMLLSALVTFFVVYEPAGTMVAQAALGGSAAASVAIAADPFGWAWLRAVLEPLVPWTVLGWLIGVGVNALGLLGDFRQLRTTLATARPLESPWPDVVDRISRALGVRRVVRVLESARVGVPIVVGWLRPVIIIPPSALLGLSPRQLELIIGHELAHVARFDYLFNLAQLFVETVLFYHPAVHFVGRAVRLERENCCDDAVVERTGETLAYAKALTEIEGLRCSAGLRPAAAATGGDLKFRIRRLVAMPDPQRGAVGWLAAMTLLAVSFGTVVGGARLAVEPPVPVIETTSVFLSGPANPVFGTDTSRDDASPAPATVDSEAQRAAPTVPLVETPQSLPVSTAPAVVETESRGSSAPAPVARQADIPVTPSAAPPQMTPAVAKATQAPAAPVPPTAGGDSVPQVSPEAAAPPAVTAVAATLPTPLAPPASAPLTDEAGASADSAAPSPPEPEFTAPAAQAPPEPAPTTTESLAPAAPVTLAAAMPEKNESQPVLTGGEVTRSPAPNYPRRARMRGVEGQVTVRYHVDTRGRVGEIEVLSARPAGIFDKAVTKAVRKWRHEPFMAAGQRVAQAVTQTFDFGIRREEVVAGKDENAAACRRVTGSRLCRSGDAYQELGVVVVQNPL